VKDWTTPDEIRTIKRSFYKMAQFPDVLGTVEKRIACGGHVC
jgi:hypothetical protein